ncbi:MAG: DUF2062 domain-containing protein [Deltaproteobacteria bacterium]|nr:DUF2062 domain-containing protein [Deltaproteobacteria bacterium]
MFKKKIAFFVEKIKKLNGDPHYVAFGMAIGVFVSITPTIPFHTILAVTLAILLKASKPAALIGVWVSNPFTVVFLYLASYKVGHFFFGNSMQALKSIEVLIHHLETDIDFSQKIIYFTEFIKTKIKTFMIMTAGGALIGLPSGLVAYFITRNFFAKLRRKN